MVPNNTYDVCAGKRGVPIDTLEVEGDVERAYYCVMYIDQIYFRVFWEGVNMGIPTNFLFGMGEAVM